MHERETQKLSKVKTVVKPLAKTAPNNNRLNITSRYLRQINPKQFVFIQEPLVLNYMLNL